MAEVVEEGQDVWIPLGYSCTVADALRFRGMRQEAFPLDWVVTPIQGLMDCLAEDFGRLFTELRPHPNGSSVLDAHAFQYGHDIPTKMMAAPGDPEVRVRLPPGWEADVAAQRAKYARRIQRFRGTLASAARAGRRVWFVRHLDATPEQASELFRLIARMYPRLLFTLVVIRSDAARPAAIVSDRTSHRGRRLLYVDAGSAAPSLATAPAYVLPIFDVVFSLARPHDATACPSNVIKTAGSPLDADRRVVAVTSLARRTSQESLVAVRESMLMRLGVSLVVYVDALELRDAVQCFRHTHGLSRLTHVEILPGDEANTSASQLRWLELAAERYPSAAGLVWMDPDLVSASPADPVGSWPHAKSDLVVGDIDRCWVARTPGTGTKTAPTLDWRAFGGSPALVRALIVVRRCMLRKVAPDAGTRSGASDSTALSGLWSREPSIFCVLERPLVESMSAPRIAKRCE